MKKITVLGTGMVGNTIGSKLVQLGYEVMMGARTGDNPKAREWAAANGERASQGSFAEAASFGELIFNCTKGEFAVTALEMAGSQHLAGKTVIDISNPLDFSKGMPPTLIPSLVNTHSLGEELQQRFPEAHIVKSLNIVNCEVMVDAARCGAGATMFMAGNDERAKAETKALMQQFGWQDIIDLGDIRHARSTEMMLPIWLSVYMATKNPYVGFRILRIAP